MSALIIDDGILDTPAAPLPEVAGDVMGLVYITFTSGSTGTPKGVVIGHRAVMNTLEDINECFDLNAQGRAFGLSLLNLSLSAYDAFASFTVDATLILPETGRGRDSRHQQTVIVYGHISVWNAVPVLMQVLCEYHSGDRMSYPTLRLALLSGDWIPLTLPEQVREWLNEATDIISLGEATECTIWPTCYPIGKVKSTWTSIPYDQGLRNQPVYVLSAQPEEYPIGVEGEIYIDGMGLA